MGSVVVIALYRTSQSQLVLPLPRILQQQNEELRRRVSLSTHKMEAMEAEFDGSRHYMEAELSRTRDDLDKMRDKFRR